jgi:hypothetical protein
MLKQALPFQQGVGNVDYLVLNRGPENKLAS